LKKGKNMKIPSHFFNIFVIASMLVTLAMTVQPVPQAAAATTWQTVGSAGFSAGLATFTSLALDASGTPYVAYKDGTNSSKASVMKYGSPEMVFDHTSIDLFTNLSSSDIASASNIRMMLRRASVGGNISEGLDTLQAQNAIYNRNNWAFQDRGNPGWQAKVDDFVQQVPVQLNSFDVFSMKFCFIDTDANWAYYRDHMLQLEAQHPGKKFIWWTIPITTGGSSQYDAFNTQVRAYARDNGKILFDLADIESNGVKNSSGFEVMNATYSSDGGHLNATGSLRAAKVFWVMMSAISKANVAPSVQSIMRTNPNPTTASSVDFTVTFSEDVSGVDKTDFTLTASPSISGHSVSSVTPVSTSVYTVTVNTGTGSGIIHLNVMDDDSIVDGSSNPLGGPGSDNGNFTSGETYLVRPSNSLFLPLIMR
jgi:hypothetical protein